VDLLSDELAGLNPLDIKKKAKNMTIVPIKALFISILISLSKVIISNISEKYIWKNNVRYSQF
jgi:hypothetical protein